MIVFQGAGQFFDAPSERMLNSVVLRNTESGREVRLEISAEDLEQVMGLYNDNPAAPRKTSGSAQADLRRSGQRVRTIPETTEDHLVQPLARDVMVETLEDGYSSPPLTEEDMMMIEASAVPGEL
jgi:hypothetical protein